jgi:pre-mRNA-splicing helicase BRR2
VGGTARYRPLSGHTRAAWDALLGSLRKVVGDVSDSDLVDIAEEVVTFARASDRKGAEAALGSSLADEWSKLEMLSMELSDFDAGTSSSSSSSSATAAAASAGYAVTFDEEDEKQTIGSAMQRFAQGFHTSLGPRGEDDDEEDDEGGAGEDAEMGAEIAAAKTLEAGTKRSELVELIKSKGLLPLSAIDAFWVHRELGKSTDEEGVPKLAVDVLRLLGEANDARLLENGLVSMLGFEQFDLVKQLIANRARVVWMVRYRQATSDEDRSRVRDEMASDTTPVVSDGGGSVSGLGLDCGASVLEELRTEEDASGWTGREASRSGGFKSDMASSSGAKAAAAAAAARASMTSSSGPRELDLDAMTFRDAGLTMTNQSVVLQSSTTVSHKGYEEIYVPALKPKPMGTGERLIPIGDLPEWCWSAFAGMKSLNRVQSRLCSFALESSSNLLLCAPTGAGKTNVAVLTILQQIGRYRRPDGSVDTSSFKIVYVAPMKALVQEIVQNLSQRLTEAYGVQVRELSGDQNLTASQLNETQIIVTTPEKWDIVTRKAGQGRSFTRLVKLVIIDEVHLLHDARGPVLEALVARTLRTVETTRDQCRLVGLSATLPNYEDVATFLRVDPSDGLFFFDGSYRPCPLQQTFVGVTDRKALKRINTMNEVTYAKIEAQAGEQQAIVFVHSRKDTSKTARALRDMALSRDALGKFLQEGSASRLILQEQAEKVKDQNLKDLLPYGFGIHHAGMSRPDRELVEALFDDGHIQVLCSTATLAWGVNLPAHLVVIKGTQIYDPEKGGWTELSPQDVLQMLGRAGRPQFDTFGEGVVVTDHDHLRYYTSLLNEQLPIESQMIKALPDHLNAEISAGSVSNLRDAARWLTYTYLFVRMLRRPDLYGCAPGGPRDSPEEIELAVKDALGRDPLLLQHRLNLAHTAAVLLDKHGLVRYDRASGSLQPTALGRVAAHYYITHPSVAVYNEHMKPTMTDIGLFRLFSLSHEFRNIVVREEEREELVRMRESVPVPIREASDEPSCKINILLQAYISRLKLDGLALVADMTYVQQSAGRIFRALFEVALRRGWAALSRRCLAFCQMIDHRVWLPHTPLRQFASIAGVSLPEEICLRIERRGLPWERYFDMRPADLGELVRLPKLGKALHKLVHSFPKLELAAQVQPVSRSIIRVDLTVAADFEWSRDFHGTSQAFWIVVEDGDGENILHHEQFSLRERDARVEQLVSFIVPIPDPLPPQVFVRVLSDRWLHSESCLPISFRKLVLPAKFNPPTELLDLRPQTLEALGVPAFRALYDEAVVGQSRAVSTFNPIQTQCFSALYSGKENVLVAAAPGAGKTLCAELALLNLWRADPDALAVYVSPHSSSTKEVMQEWTFRFGQGLTKSVVELTGESAVDLKLLSRAHLVVSSVENWDRLSRRWRQRRAVQRTALFIVDDLHLVGGAVGARLEVIVSRMRYMGAQIEAARKGTALRIVGLSSPIANSKDVADWIGVPNSNRFAFHPRSRPQPLDVRIQPFDVPHYPARLSAMARPCYVHISSRCGGKDASRPGLVFVPSRAQAETTAVDILSFAAAEGSPLMFQRAPEGTISMSLERVEDTTLRHCLLLGVGFLHEGLSDADVEIVEQLFHDGFLSVCVVVSSMCWDITLRAHAVVIMGTEVYDGREQRHVDLPIASLLRMTGRACRPREDKSGFVAIMCSAARREYLKRFLFEPLPVESHLDQFLHDPLCAEVASKTIESKPEAVDWLTWSFLFRRLPRNPNYYHLAAATSAHMSDFFSELVETVLTDLEASGCVAMDGPDKMQVSPLNLGMIAAFYDVQHTTMEVFATSITDRTKTRGLLEVLSAAAEFELMPVRHGEDLFLERTARHLPYTLAEDTDWTNPHTKVQVLLQCHMQRSKLPVDLRRDLESVLKQSLPLLGAMVDVCASQGWLKPALAVMGLSQMLVQGVWRTHPHAELLQLPWFDEERAAVCAESTYVPEPEEGEDDAEGEPQPVDSVFAFMEMNEDLRVKLLSGLSPEQTAAVAEFCNRFPSIELSWEVEGATSGDGNETHAIVEPSSTIAVHVSLSRDEATQGLDEGAGVGAVIAPRFPIPKSEGWWVAVGDSQGNKLYGLKRVTLSQEARVTVPVQVPAEVGKHDLDLVLISDSYIGCDQEHRLLLKVSE